MEQNNISFDALYKNSDYFSRNVIFMSKIMNQFWSYDSVTDEAMIGHMDSVCKSLSVNDFCDMNDYFEKIAMFSKYSIKNIIREINTKIQREHRMLPVRQVKETDSRTMQWLATKQGRNIREKLSGKNKVLAPVRYYSCNTHENKIFKAFLSALKNYFIYWEKTDFHNKSLEALYYEIYAWLKSEDANYILTLNSSTPNNILLNDKNYRKIWKAWNNIQLLDATVRNDCKNDVLKYNFGLTLTYLAVAELVKSGVLFYQQPFLPSKINTYNFIPLQHSIITKKQTENILYFQGYYSKNKNIDNALVEITLKTDGLYINIKDDTIVYKSEHFEKWIYWKDLISINLELKERIKKALKKISGSSEAEDYRDAENNCAIFSLDCTQEQPYFSYEENDKIQCNKLKSKLIAQKWIWEDTNKVQIIPSPFLKIEENGETLFNITIRDVIDSNPRFTSADYLNSAQIFAKQLKAIFPKANHFIYLVPDKLDDFGDNYLAVSFDANFPNAVPVPRSIARVFQWQKSKEFSAQKFLNDSFVRIIEHSENGLLYVTDIKAKLPDDKTKNILEQNNIPQCITWERQPTEVSKNIKEITNRNIIKVFDIDNESLLTDGALYYFIKQQNIVDIPLWNDHLLELSMMADNTPKPISLVGPDTVVKTRKGKKERIVVPQKDLIIDAGKPFVEFRLIIGKDDEKQKKYYAYVENSTIMPFTEDTSCELELFYSYGEQKPYTLYLKTNIDGDIKWIEVKWEKESHKDYVHVPGPNYINELSWPEVYSKKIKNLLSKESVERTRRALDTISNFGWQTIQIQFGSPRYPPKVYFSDWKDSNGNSISCFIKNKNKNPTEIIGMNVKCSIVPSENKDGTLRLTKNQEITYTALDLQINDEEINKSELNRYIDPFFRLWDQGRTLKSPECPKELYSITQDVFQSCDKIINNSEIPIEIKNEVLIILSSLHEDADTYFSKIILEIMENTIKKQEDNPNSLYHRKRLINAIGYAIGNVSLPWQKELLEKSIILGTESYSDIENNMAIEIMGNALWKTRNCILALSYNDVEILFNLSVKNIENFCKIYQAKYSNLMNQPLEKDDIKTIWRLKFTCLRAIELILALYRLRNHAGEIDESILKLLAPSPDNKLIARLKEQFSVLEDFCIKDKEKAQEQEYEQSRNDKYRYISITSRIEFEVNDPNRNQDIPDYLYVLEKYTQGEGGGIKVLRITEDKI